MDTKNLGEFIRNLREERGWTQNELAQDLQTSQSAVARMENGEQNLTTEHLNEIFKGPPIHKMQNILFSIVQHK